MCPRTTRERFLVGENASMSPSSSVREPTINSEYRDRTSKISEQIAGQITVHSERTVPRGNGVLSCKLNHAMSPSRCTSNYT